MSKRYDIVHKNRQPSLFSIFSKDDKARWGLILLAGGWGLYIVNAGKRDVAWIFFCIAIAATVIGPIITLARISFYRDFFDRGVRVPTHIISKVQVGKRGTWVEFKYKYQDQEYRRSAYVYRRWEFTPGDVTGLIIDPDEPEQCFLESDWL